MRLNLIIHNLWRLQTLHCTFYVALLQNLNGYNRAALAEAVFDVEHELFNEGMSLASS